MAYTPTVWETGDVITAEKLNKAEEGIADASPMIVEFSEEDGTLVANKELNAVLSALSAGKPVNFFLVESSNHYVYHLESFSYYDDGSGIDGAITLQQQTIIGPTGVGSFQLEWSSESGIVETPLQYPDDH